MKTILRLLACIALPATLHAATWTVDNNTAHPADFRTIQAAVDAAEVGDTILVAGSNDAYEGFELTKRLNIKGERPIDLSFASKIGNVMLTEVFDDISPDHLRNASNSVLEGLEIGILYIRGRCTGVVIKRCYSPGGGIWLEGCSGALIVNCVFQHAASLQIYTPDDRVFTGTGNSIVGSSIQSLLFNQPTNTLIENCVIGIYVGGASQSVGPINTWNDTAPFVIRNSIVIGKSSVFAQVVDNSSNNAKVAFDHCLIISESSLPTVNGNINRAYNQFATVFMNATPYSTNPDGFVLKAGSPAVGAGIGGVDLGMHGGISPFVKDFIPAIPRINYLAVPPMVPDSTGLTFEVRAEARD